MSTLYSNNNYLYSCMPVFGVCRNHLYFSVLINKDSLTESVRLHHQDLFVFQESILELNNYSKYLGTNLMMAAMTDTHR